MGLFPRSVCAALLLATTSLVQAANPAELDAIRGIMSRGDLGQALQRLDAYVEANPDDDAEARFLKGLILAEQNDTDRAIEIFAALTKDYPGLPEPHNNLAVLYASQGQYVRARDALTVAINTHPTYATAHENLGDIYAKMAGIAYDKALELDSNNEAAKSKLDLVRDLFSVRRAETADTKPLVVTAPRPSSVEARSAPPPASTSVAESVPTDPAVLETVQAWADAWSGKDAAAYLAFYADDYQPPRGMSRSRWEAQRRIRLNKPNFIEVEISQASVEMRGTDRAKISFVQDYRSDTYQDQVTKALQLSNNGGQWRIVEETSLP